MMKIHSYLTFAGNCREAMNFYQECFGGELTFQTIGETPLAEGMPPEMKSRILHSSLTKNNLVLMASDMVPDAGLIKGNAVSLSLECSSEDEIRSTFEKLAAGGKKDHPLEDTFWGALFGDLTDKFGNHWLLHCENVHHTESIREM
jgi:PhnB protein